MSVGKQQATGHIPARRIRLPMNSITQHLRAGNELTEGQITEACTAILNESISVETKAGFLVALAEKGETPAEIAIFVNQFLERAIEPGLDCDALGKPLLDVCGTGGDKLDLFNVSTTSVFVLAAAGIGVVKHGNRGITSKSGGADVLEALGIRIDLSPEDFCHCVEKVGAGFLFAPLYHPAFKAVAPVRGMLAERGQRTIFNLLGPLLNPVRPDYQLIGVFDGAVGPAFAEILDRLGRKNAWSVHGTTNTGAGMDELSTLGESQIWSVKDGRIETSRVDPVDLGIDPPTCVEELQGGDAEENAKILEAILDGSEIGPKRDIVCLNAAAGMTIVGQTADLKSGLIRANEIIDSGAAMKVLRDWQGFS